MQTFQEKVNDRVREAIADLMPKEAIDEIIKRQVEKSFFEDVEVEVRYGSYDTRRERRPSLFIQAVVEAGKPLIEAAAKRFVEENQETLQEAVRQFLDREKFLLLAVSHMQANTFSTIEEVVSKVVQRIKDGRY